MTNIQPTDHGVRAWSREDFPGQGKALGHTKNKFSDLLSSNLPPVQPPEITPEENQEVPTNSVQPIETTDTVNLNESQTHILTDIELTTPSQETSTFEFIV